MTCGVVQEIQPPLADRAIPSPRRHPAASSNVSPIETLEARRLLGAAVSTVLNNGPAANRIDIAVVGDGFTQTQLPTFAADVQTFIKGFFDEAPLSSYKSFFNVHEVNVVSSVSGVSGDPSEGITKATPLGMSFWTDGVERLLGVDTVAAKQFASSAPGHDQTIAIANSSKYGGAAIHQKMSSPLPAVTPRQSKSSSTSSVILR